VCGRSNFCSSGSEVVLTTQEPVSLESTESLAQNVGSASFIATNAELHEVRCCSDVSLPGWTKNFWCDVWTESDFGGDCFEEKDFSSAESICILKNGRLCTKEELEKNCAKGSGCGFDYDFVWSSTPGDPTEMPTVAQSLRPSWVPSFAPTLSIAPSSSSSPTIVEYEFYFALCGRRDRCSEREGSYPVDTEHEVRCCAEEKIDNSFKKKANCDVWASSYINGKCIKEATHQEASISCSNIGARLCTVDELNGDCTRGTGCGFDNEIIWSSALADPPSNSQSKSKSKSKSKSSKSKSSGSKSQISSGSESKSGSGSGSKSGSGSESQDQEEM